jgi:hypothetical protein
MYTKYMQNKMFMLGYFFSSIHRSSVRGSYIPLSETLAPVRALLAGASSILCSPRSPDAVRGLGERAGAAVAVEGGISLSNLNYPTQLISRSGARGTDSHAYKKYLRPCALSPLARSQAILPPYAFAGVR